MNYNNTVEKIKLIKKNLTIRNNYYEYLKEQVEFLIEVDELRKGIKSINEIVDLDYDSSHANTEYCVNKYGKEVGLFLSGIAKMLRKSLDYLSEQNIEQAYLYNKIFIDTYNYLTSHNKINIDDMKAIYQYTDEIDSYLSIDLEDKAN